MAEADPTKPSSQALLSIEGFRAIEFDKATAVRNVGFEGRDIRSRPFKLLRTQLTKLLAGNGARLVGLTSSTPAAGKSFLSLNIAASLAQLGERAVYLVDLDLRRASMAEQLGLSIETGVDSFLRGEVQTLREIGLRFDDLPLVLLPTGQVTSGSEEYISAPTFGHLIQLLRTETHNAIVLFDLPPVFASDDAMISIEALDGYLMVVDSGNTTRRQLLETIEMLRPSPLLGTILNRYKGGLLDSYGYYTHTYDRYYGT